MLLSVKGWPAKRKQSDPLRKAVIHMVHRSDGVFRLGVVVGTEKLSGDLRRAVSLMVIWGIICLFRRVGEPKFVGAQTGLSPILSLICTGSSPASQEMIPFVSGG